MYRCESCGFAQDLSGAPQAAPAILTTAAELAQLLVAAADPGQRHQEQVWSPLEYCCHVRDVLLVQRERVLTARRTDRPATEPMGRDERVEHDGYSEQEPTDVARQLGDAAQMFANVLVRLSPSDWERTLLYNYPEPAERSLRWVAIHTLHEVIHHVDDVRSQIP